MNNEIFIQTITALFAILLGFIILNGISEHMKAAWPLCIVISAGLLSLGLTSKKRD
jgi:flagellar motor component MotA